ncbi:NAD(P)-dependent oxidoreductase [Streptomyces alboflavus]|uniref:NAD(P)-dependent oxidoreductase n=1 Tax=Streptomyces alboflavus TaxID=67267 RepID=UPI001387513B|nr:hydroxyacid dehydrogenase [Streptomyces alboflavus]
MSVMDESVEDQARQRRLLILDPFEAATARALADDFDVTERVQPPQDELLTLVRDADAIVVRSGVRITAEVLNAAPKLRIIARAGVGVDNIDLATARANGVTVFNVPGGSANAVAELALGLMFSAARNIALADGQVRRNIWRKAELGGTELTDKVLGLVGLGAIGSRIATLCRAIGMSVVATVGSRTPERVATWSERGVDIVDSLDEVLDRADFLCLAVPLTERTRSLLSATELVRMKPSAYLVNVSRGGVVDEDALLDALKNGEISGAATDVLKNEKHPTPLSELDNIVLTPHIGAMTHETQARIGAIVAENIRAAFAGRHVENRVC